MSKKATHIALRGRTRPVRTYCGQRVNTRLACISIRAALSVVDTVALCSPCEAQSRFDLEIEQMREVARQRRQKVCDQLVAKGLKRFEARAAMRMLERVGQLRPLLAAVVLPDDLFGNGR
jgi:hypothetical protein